MKLSSILILIGIIVLFTVFEGWYLIRTYWMPRDIIAAEATLLQRSLTVGTPVAGIVWDVRIRENEPVRKGQFLFVVIPQTQTEPQGGRPVFIPSYGAGRVVEIHAERGDFVQASKEIARIIDTSPSAQYIEATFDVSIAEWLRVHPGQDATVRSLQLADGKALPAIVTTVDPSYNAREQQGTLRLELLADDIYAGVPSVGIPVDVTIAIENDNRFKRVVLRIARAFAPSSLAEQL